MKRARRGVMPEPARVSGQGIHMPNPSYWPVVAAVGVLAVLLSLMFLSHTGVVGVVAAVGILFLGVCMWAFEPAG
jgi:hypothetical protein